MELLVSPSAVAIPCPPLLLDEALAERESERWLPERTCWTQCTLSMKQKHLWHNAHEYTRTHTHIHINMYVPFAIKGKTTINVNVQIKHLSKKWKFNLVCAQNTLRSLVVVMLHRRRKQQQQQKQQHSLFPTGSERCLSCLWHGACNKHNKCVFICCSEVQQTNKTQSLNAKQVFLVCSFPPPWPKPKAQAQSSPTNTHTHIQHL